MTIQQEFILVHILISLKYFRKLFLKNLINFKFFVDILRIIINLYYWGFYRYKSEKNEVPVTLANGSTVPLVSMLNVVDGENNDYDPFANRSVPHPTS